VTEAQARRVANVILASAGVAAAVVVITTPPLRRLALNALRHWLNGASVPAYLAGEARRAWIAAGTHGAASPQV
jgi:hypothetical protein